MDANQIARLRLRSYAETECWPGETLRMLNECLDDIERLMERERVADKEIKRLQADHDEHIKPLMMAWLKAEYPLAMKRRDCAGEEGRRVDVATNQVQMTEYRRLWLFITGDDDLHDVSKDTKASKAPFATRKPGVPSREETYEILKARSLELQSGGGDDG